MLTDVSRDGTLTGPNTALLQEFCDRTDRPVVASGGVSSLAVVLEALGGLDVEVVLAAGTADLTSLGELPANVRSVGYLPLSSFLGTCSAIVHHGGSGSTDFAGIRDGIGSSLAEDPLILIGIALVATGLAFKISIAPFHQWTPDVYQGAPTPVTAFMAVATKAAAFAVFARFFEIALGPAVGDWQPALAALAAVSIIVGNVGALTQSSLKRLLGYSSVAQAGYMLVGIVAAKMSVAL